MQRKDFDIFHYQFLRHGSEFRKLMLLRAFFNIRIFLESAMGSASTDQKNENRKKYKKAIYDFGEIVSYRLVKQTQLQHSIKIIHLNLIKF